MVFIDEFLEHFLDKRQEIGSSVASARIAEIIFGENPEAFPENVSLNT